MILTIHSSGQETELQLVRNDGSVIGSDKWESGRSLSDDLLAHINKMIADQTKELNDLTGVIIFSGPGSFTSLRIGHTVANALADGLGIPVVGAMQDNWIEEGIIELKTSGSKEPALPFYGAEANITKPNH